MKKIIGITATQKQVGMNFSSGLIVACCPQIFIDIVSSCGGLPIILPASLSVEDAKDVISSISGLILTSGEDISPEFYLEKQRITYQKTTGVGAPYHRPEALQPHPQRDAVEIALYRAAREKGLPVLGICRGMQLMNVAEGGSLHQELEDTNTEHLIESDGWVHYHPVSIEQNTALGRLFKRAEYTTSSVHHQGIKDLAPSFVAAAYAPDGLIEMIEARGASVPVWGVQGHPEKTTKNYPVYKQMFSSFINGTLTL